MAMAILAPVSERQGREMADLAVHAVAERLTAAGLDVRSPDREGSCFLKITNVRGTFCEVSISDDGRAMWEYRPFSGSAADPARITRMITDILGARAADDRGVPAGRFPGVTLKGIVGPALRESGMQVKLNVVDVDDALCDVYAEIEITSPDQPARGIVRVDDDGVIRWECRFREPAAGITGIDPAEFTATMARILAGSPEPPAAS